MDRRLGRLALLLLLSLGLTAERAVAATPQAPDLKLLDEQNRVKQESEAKIQEDVLDPILGKGAAIPFVDVEMEVKVESEESTRTGMGLAERYREKQSMQAKAGMQTTYVLPGVPTPKTISSGDKNPPKPDAAQATQAQQIKGVQEQRFAVKPVFKKLGVTVIHDDDVLKDKAQVDLVRSRIVDVMSQYQLAPDQVAFRPTRFKKLKIDWRDDLKKPSVYLPLLYALLTLLFLIFLFGPLWRFLRAYVQALKEKPGAEVNIEDERGDGDGDGDEDSNVTSDGKLAMTIQRKPSDPPPPPPPPPEDEEDEMNKKFEPFTYINEENVKRLSYLFILRKEEPWVIATVASYLRPDLARQMLMMLPVELQARVAVEALTVRQVTKDQVNAIDADVKENVDFVVGGMERLTALLDEADVFTRNNILTYLKNEKPLVYDSVRRFILVFDDIANFPDREMQVIVRELKTEVMARALQGAPPEVVQKFFGSMSAGAASLLKESMEYVGQLSQLQIEEERSKIMELVKTLEKDGKVNVRQKNDGGGYHLVEGMQEELGAMERRQKAFNEARRKAEAILHPERKAEAAQPAAAAVDPAQVQQAQQYFDYGVSQVDAGQFEPAIQYLQYAVQLNPELWQAHQYLGNAFYGLGRIAEAVAEFEQVLAYNPDPQLRQWVEGLKAQAR